MLLKKLFRKMRVRRYCKYESCIHTFSASGERLPPHPFKGRRRDGAFGKDIDINDRHPLTPRGCRPKTCRSSTNHGAATLFKIRGGKMLPKILNTLKGLCPPSSEMRETEARVKGNRKERERPLV